jgi:hypothetical protein
MNIGAEMNVREQSFYVPPQLLHGSLTDRDVEWREGMP